MYLPRKHSEIKYILREKSSLGYVSNIKGIISAFKESGVLCHLGKNLQVDRNLEIFLTFLH